jgi:hypothetical protein
MKFRKIKIKNFLLLKIEFSDKKEGKLNWRS